jgi:hypothetical protein
MTHGTHDTRAPRPLVLAPSPARPSRRSLNDAAQAFAVLHGLRVGKRTRVHGRSETEITWPLLGTDAVVGVLVLWAYHTVPTERTLRDAVMDLFYGALERQAPGWEINEGSQGSVRLDVATARLHLDHEWNTTEGHAWDLDLATDRPDLSSDAADVT